MIESTVIYPQERKTKITCSQCEISYTPRDYEILFENKKLIYFKSKTILRAIPQESAKINKYITSCRRLKVFCSDCLFEFAKKIGKIMEQDEIKLRIFAEDGIYNCKVYVLEDE